MTKEEMFTAIGGIDDRLIQRSEVLTKRKNMHLFQIMYVYMLYINMVGYI